MNAIIKNKNLARKYLNLALDILPENQEVKFALQKIQDEEIDKMW